VAITHCPQSPIPNPQYTIPKHQSKFKNIYKIFDKKIKKK